MKCECSGEMNKAKIKIAPDLFSEGYKCRKCNKVEFNEEQMRKALELKENALNLAVTRKLGVLGGSLILRIPKAVKEALHLKAGASVKIIAEKKKITLQPM